MKQRKLMYWLFIIVGFLLAFISLGADWLGFGNSPGINRSQILGASIGEYWRRNRVNPIG